VPCQLVEFDHLITQPLIKDGQDFKDFVTPVSKAETSALGDPYLRSSQQGEVATFTYYLIDYCFINHLYYMTSDMI
jgi:hypothetical protein